VTADSGDGNEIASVPADPGASLALVKEHAFPRMGSGVQPFAEGGSKWWLNDDGVPKLYGMDSAAPERVVNSLAVAVSSVRRHGLALWASGDGVFAADLVEGKEAFRIAFKAPPVAPPGAPLSLVLGQDRGSVWGVSATQSELALAVESWEGRKLLLLDRTSGAVLWETPARWRGYSADPALGAEAVYVRIADVYEARAARSGERLWAVAAPGSSDWSPHLHRDAVALALRNGELTLVEARSGQERCSVALSGEVKQVFSWGGQLLLELSEREHFRLVAFEGKTCRRLWSSAPSSGGVSILAARDHLLLRDADRLLLLDQRGTLVWHYGLGRGDALAFEERDGSPRLALTSSELNTNSVRVFASRAAPDPLEPVRVHGRITDDGQAAAGVRVAAYGTETRSDEQGHYELNFSARGAVAVSVDQFGESTPFALSGKRVYEANFDHSCEDCE
jgi:hypothetical protein